MSPADAIEMYVALMGFTGSVHPNIVENVNQVLGGLVGSLSVYVSIELLAQVPSEHQWVSLSVYVLDPSSLVPNPTPTATNQFVGEMGRS